MGAKIQADEISSIIKERIDNFELNVDYSGFKHDRTHICIVGCGIEAQQAMISLAKHIDIIDIVHADSIKNIDDYIINADVRMRELVQEQVELFEVMYPILKDIEKPNDWYRKFEKKKRWQK
jgi:hypothetical protein